MDLGESLNKLTNLFSDASQCLHDALVRRPKRSQQQVYDPCSSRACRHSSLIRFHQ